MACEKFSFERQYRENFLDVFLYRLYAPFLPCPYFRRDVIVGRDSDIERVFSYFQIERRVVDENKCVGAEFGNRLLCPFHVAEDCWQMAQHLGERHKSHLLVVCYGTASRGMLHTVASEECKRGVVVVFANSFDQASGMQVARCFASDKEVFHKRKDSEKFL